jgi:hypothetical protein
VPPGTLGVDTYTLPLTVTEKMARTILGKAKMEKKKTFDGVPHMYV